MRELHCHPGLPLVSDGAHLHGLSDLWHCHFNSIVRVLLRGRRLLFVHCQWLRLVQWNFWLAALQLPGNVGSRHGWRLHCRFLFRHLLDLRVAAHLPIVQCNFRLHRLPDRCRWLRVRLQSLRPRPDCHHHMPLVQSLRQLQCVSRRRLHLVRASLGSDQLRCQRHVLERCDKRLSAAVELHSPAAIDNPAGLAWRLTCRLAWRLAFRLAWRLTCRLAWRLAFRLAWRLACRLTWRLTCVQRPDWCGDTAIGWQSDWCAD